MTRVVYYVAVTQDGFIAGPKGELDWLHPFESPQEDYGYADFLAGVDGLVMGRTTFDVTLGFGPWPYGERPAWVLTRRALVAPPMHVQPTRAAPAELVARWRAMGLQRVWLVGGGAVAGAFAAAGLIDELVLSTVPVTMGEGIAAFGDHADPLARFVPVAGSSRDYPNGLRQQRWVRVPAAVPLPQSAPSPEASR